MASILISWFQVARSRDKVALTRVLGTLAVGHGERSFEDPFLHTLVKFSSKFSFGIHQ